MERCVAGRRLLNVQAHERVLVGLVPPDTHRTQAPQDHRGPLEVPASLAVTSSSTAEDAAHLPDISAGENPACL
jgi:hypothetical protein